MDSYPYTSEELLALQPWLGRPVPLPPPVARSAEEGAASAADRARGMLLAVAVGDSLGNTSEGLSPEERRRLHGEIRDYLPHPREDMRRVGFPSDDTQLTFWTVESLLRRGCLDPADLAESFAGPRIFGLGKTVTAFLLAYRFGRRSWFEAGGQGAGNGALMRISPIVIPHLPAPGRRLWRDVIAATILTHRDEAAVAACVGFTGIIAECLARRPGDAPPARWWVETFLRYARPVEGKRGAAGAVARAAAAVAAGQNSSDVGPGDAVDDDAASEYEWRSGGEVRRGTLCDRVEQTALPAAGSQLSVLEAAESWGSGGYLLETVPCVLHVLAAHASEPEEALVRAVNDTADNDTIAAVTGSALGALHGSGWLPSRWLDALLGRTVEDDDGRVQSLAEQVATRFALRRGMVDA